MIVFAGDGAAGKLSGVWVLVRADETGGTPRWYKLSPTGAAPPASGYIAGTYEAGTNRMTVFRGWTCCQGPLSNEAWVLTNANGSGGTPQWIKLAPIGTPPSPRAGARAAYRPAPRNSALYVAGSGTSQVWLLTGANGAGATPAWKQVAPIGTAPPGRGGIAFTSTPTRPSYS